MCIRPPCPNCGAGYDACMGECPQCGHPDNKTPTMFKFKVVTKEVPCKICKCNHTVTSYEVEK